MHSFEASRNKLIWLIQIVVDTPASPDVSEEFPIRVVPDVAGAG